MSAQTTPSAIQILEQRCFKCHGETKQLGQLDARTVGSLQLGGKRGPAIVPGSPEDSRLLQLIRPGAKPHMPPGKTQLDADEIQSLTAWIASLPPQTPEQPTWDSAAATPPTEDPADPLPSAHLEPSIAIDFFLQSRYGERNITPAPITSDSEFVRRIYLDLLSRIPTPSEAQAFLSSSSSQKRFELIAALLESNECAQQLALKFDVLLMDRSERRLADRERHGWHRYLETVFRENRSWHEVAAETLLAQGDSEDRGHLWFLHERNNDHSAIAESIAKSFFGVDIACAQCHDHPLAPEIHQAHYWGLVAFFNRSKNTKSDRGIAIAESAIGGFTDYANALTGSTDPAHLVFLDREIVPDPRPEDLDKQEDKEEYYRAVDQEPRVPKFSRRAAFVEHVLTDHPLLARAMVNRVWALCMGRGLVHPYNRMDSEHPPSHPQLLNWLARDFETHNYSIRRLFQSILNSQAYQRRAGLPADAEESDFACGLEKPLSAEAFSRSLVVAVTGNGLDQQESEELAKAFRQQFPEVLPENKLSTLKQTMMLSNHPLLHQTLVEAARSMQRQASTVGQVRGLYDRLYLREPADEELLTIVDYLNSKQDRPADAMAQVLWAMLCSAEFRFNH